MSDAEVCGALQATLSPDKAQRKQAETYLVGLEAAPGFAVHLLQLVQQHCATQQPQSALIRASAAVYFKNLIKRGWDDSAESDVPHRVVLSASDRSAIKAHMVKLVVLCGHAADVQAQLSAALSIISASDFPGKWPDLLPEIISQLATGDMRTVCGMLLTANSILKRFRDAFKSDELYTELKYVLNMFAAPLTALFIKLGEALNSKNLADPAEKKNIVELLEALRLCSRVFFSLNWQDLPEFFEDNMASWMPAFERYAHLELPLLRSDDDDAVPLERLQASIVENVSLYASKYEDEFAGYLPKFTSAIWGLLMRTSAAPKFDHLAATAIRFLASVIGKSMHAHLFQDPATLRQIVEQIVVPNMSLRDADVELFEDSPSEYVSADFESADADTRRRGARDLVSAMCKHHESATTAICSEHVGRMLQAYAANAEANWRQKDAALHLIVAVSVRAESQQRGVSQTSAQLDVVDIFRQHVLPELQDANAQTRPVLKADAIQFACTFRNQLPPDVLVGLLPLLATHLRSPVHVVHTYAAACLERILTTHVDPSVPSSPLKIGRAHLAPLLGPLFEALFGVLDAAGSSAAAEASFENEYVMKAVMRLLVVGEQDVLPVAAVIIDKLTRSLGKVCANPRNPRFNHYLFEALSVLLRVACASQGAAMAQKFEALLFPPFQTVLQMDVVEFAPYVFQILALLLEFQRGNSGLSAAYAGLLAPLLHPSLWERRGNIPALTGLLEEYLCADAAGIVARNQLEPMLGVFQKLLASKATEPHAFALLRAIVLRGEPAATDRYLPTIFQLLLTRLQQSRDRSGFVQMFIAFVGLLAGKRGGLAAVEKLEAAAQPGMTATLAQHVWLPTIGPTTKAFNSKHEAKCAAVGLTRLLCEAPDALCANGASDAWSAVLQVVQAALQSAPTDAGGEKSIALATSDDVDALASSGFDSQFAKLAYGSKKSDDAFAEIPDVRAFVLGQLQALCATKPQFAPLVAAVGLR